MVESSKDVTLTDKSNKLLIETLHDFKPVLEFEDQGDIVALISHPGWKSHYIGCNKGFIEAYEQISKDGGEIPTGVKHANLVAEYRIKHSPGDYMDARQILLEQELFKYLEKNQIPTIVTIPIQCADKEYPNTIESHTLSKNLISDFSNYLRDVRGRRDNFYILPTVSRIEDKENTFDRGCIYDDIMGDSFVSMLLAVADVIKNKKILYAGNHLTQCAERTLSSFRLFEIIATPKKIIMLLNYFGITNENQIRIETEAEVLKDNLIKIVKEHPMESEIIKKIKEIYNTMTDLPKNTISFDGYVENLKL